MKKSIEDIVKMSTKLDAVQFIGVCKILGIEAFDKNYDRAPSTDDLNIASASDEVSIPPTPANRIPRPFENIYGDFVDKVGQLNRTQRRNLRRLLRAAIKE